MSEKSRPAAEKSATTLPGTVQKIIHSPDPSVPEKAEIAVEGADELYKEIRIENTLTDEKGQEVKLKPGAEVEVTVEAPPQATEPKNGEAQGKERPAIRQNHNAKGNGK